MPNESLELMAGGILAVLIIREVLSFLSKWRGQHLTGDEFQCNNHGLLDKIVRKMNGVDFHRLENLVEANHKRHAPVITHTGQEIYPWKGSPEILELQTKALDLQEKTLHAQQQTVTEIQALRRELKPKKEEGPNP